MNEPNLPQPNWKVALDDAITQGIVSDGWTVVSDELARWLLSGAKVMNSEETVIGVGQVGKVVVTTYDAKMN